MSFPNPWSGRLGNTQAVARESSSPKSRGGRHWEAAHYGHRVCEGCCNLKEERRS